VNPPYDDPELHAAANRYAEICPDCAGTGEFTPHRACTACAGSGEVFTELENNWFESWLCEPREDLEVPA
jgi:RecJ-like exonuclease